MTKQFKLFNNAFGWLIGIFASAVYIMTAEPTASWWDCGEYIATSYKLLVGHPPGAPTFQLLGRIFSMFAGNDVTKVAFCINTMSAICSGLTIMFLYWTMVRLGRKLVEKLGEMTPGRLVAIFGSAFVAAMTYTFSDTFWFSAVEGEVYAMSSFFTALVFWCILKWDEEYDNQKENVNPYRWLILIAYLVGLSIGVHLLNLLTLPAIVLVVYFKLSKKATAMGVVQAIGIISFFAAFFFPTFGMFLIWIFITAPTLYFSFKKGTIHSLAEWGVLFALAGSFVLLGAILYAVIPGIVGLAGKFEIFFINGIGLPFNSGTIIFFLLVFALIALGLYYGYNKDKRVLLAGVYSFVFLLIGYSTFFILVIRSNADPTIDENSPEDAVALLAYLNREQYGSNPLIYGQTYAYNPQRVTYKDGDPVYVRDDETKRYRIADKRQSRVPDYAAEDCMLFPRMWDKGHQKEYVNWLKNSYYNGNTSSDKAERKHLESGKKPTWQHNVKFLQSYQFGYMYFRYFMWNFSGRQNDIQGRGGKMDGNFITGIPAIDEMMVGSHANLPPSIERPGTNKYYLLPLILGILGMIFYFLRDTKNSFIVLLLFLMTGLAISFYLNMYAFQPRERDYAFAASFYAFAMWVGFGVFGIYSLVDKLKNNTMKVISALAITAICTALVPTIMAKENWNDHNRAHRYTALAIAKNYLDSCEPNAILFTLGDNDTFPLWYAQEVEGYRTDVRVCNLSLLSTGWYVDQMKRKAYNSEPLPISMTWEQYKDGTRDLIVLEEANRQYVNLQDIIEYLKLPEFNNKNQILFLSRDKGYRTDGAAIPASFSLPVDKEQVIANGTVAIEDSAKIVDELRWELKSEGINQILKAYIVMMDILAHNNWERPIYYASTTGPEAYFGLEEYFQLEGLAYRLVPIKTRNRGGYDIGRINTDVLYKKLIDTFEDHSRPDKVNNPDAKHENKYPYAWGGYNDPRVYNNEDNIRLTPLIRSTYQRLAEALIAEGKTEAAEHVLDRGNEVLSNKTIPYVTTYKSDYALWCINYMQVYFKLKTGSGNEKGLNMSKEIVKSMIQNFDWYESRTDRTINIHSANIISDFYVLGQLINTLNKDQISVIQNDVKKIRIKKSADIALASLDKKLKPQIEKIETNQQAVVRSLQELKNLLQFAEIIENDEVMRKTSHIIEHHLQSISNLSPQLGQAFRNFVLND